MKRIVLALSVIFTLSALTSMAAALGMQRMPDRAPPRLGQTPTAAMVTPPVLWTPSPVPLTPPPVSNTYDRPSGPPSPSSPSGLSKAAGTPLSSPSPAAGAETDPAGETPETVPPPAESHGISITGAATPRSGPEPGPGSEPEPNAISAGKKSQPEQPKQLPEADTDMDTREQPDADSPAEGEEEHIEGTDKPEAIVVAKATQELLPDFGGLPVLVNRDNILPRGYIPELVVVPGTYYQLTPETLAAYTLLMDDARKAGHSKLRLQSAYRSFDTQNSLFERKIQKFKGQYGDKAREKAAQIVAPPGQSEHQLGQAVDIANGSLVQSFGETPAGKWMADNAHHYGFILRYPKDKTPITGILYEPWHFRYVGVEVATVIYENEWTLEEFFQNHEDAQEEEPGDAA